MIVFYKGLKLFFFNTHMRIGFHCFREEGREKNIDEREKHQLVTSRTHPDRGPNQQPTYVPQPRTEPATFWLWDDALSN